MVDTATKSYHQAMSDLTWDNQAENVAAKDNRTPGFIRRTVTTSSSKATEVAYKTLLYPQMEYSACITDPHTQLLANNLERVQCCAAC